MLTDLIERLEKAEAGSRELDAEIGAWLEANATEDHGPGSNYHLSKQKTWMGVKGWEWRRWSTSIDAALTLVPEGWRIFALYGTTKGKVRDGAPSEQPWHAILEHATDWRTVSGSSWLSAPLAFCIAALRARGARHD